MNPVYCFDIKLSTKFENVDQSKEYIKFRKLSAGLTRQLVFEDSLGGKRTELYRDVRTDKDFQSSEKDLPIFNNGDIRFCLNQEFKTPELQEFDLAEALGESFFFEAELAHEYIEKQERIIADLRNETQRLKKALGTATPSIRQKIKKFICRQKQPS